MLEMIETDLDKLEYICEKNKGNMKSRDYKWIYSTADYNDLSDEDFDWLQESLLPDQILD